ncbi:MAG: DUF2334 domain-containing protein [Clostridium sp.]|uniref:DUF2334 domain-containing protein n=1 Tax=Clostridium sp. TaxID=1506 RepID=UPI003F3770CB
MMFKKSKILVLSIIILIGISPIIKANATEINKGILVLYDATNIYGTSENILNEVNLTLMQSGEKVTIKKSNFQRSESLEGYSKIVILNCNTENFGTAFIQDIDKEKNKIIYISNISNAGLKYEKKIGIESSNLNMFRNEILNSLNITNREKYLMIDNVTPFMNLNDLVSKIKYLNKNGIPFIINTIPVFENPTFKAMQNFTEVLRYAQASGGDIIMSPPYINQGGATPDEIFSAMMEGYKNYINYLVYPIGFEAQSYLLYNEGLKADLEKSNTIFIKRTGVDMSWLKDYNNPTFKNVVEEISYNGETNKIKNMKGKVAISLDGAEENNLFEEQVEQLSNNNIFFNNPRDLNTEVEISGNKIQCGAEGVYLNGKYVQQNTYISNKELFKENNNKTLPENKDDIDISGASKKLAFFAIVVCIIFIVITILSKRIDRKKYFR